MTIRALVPAGCRRRYRWRPRRSDTWRYFGSRGCPCTTGSDFGDWSGGRWRLRGYDTFAGEDYPLPGSYWTEAQAQRAARKRLAELERTQPSVSSGGQRPGGIQDQVYIVRPDG